MNFKKLTRSKDLRIKILEHFDGIYHSPSEIHANDWLASQHKDLGTIRRALLELIEQDFLSISGKSKDESFTWVKEKLDTKTTGSQTESDKDKKNSKRLIEAVGDHEQIEKIRIQTNLPGVIFLNEIRRNKRTIFYQILLVILGVVLKFLFDLIQKTNPCQ